MPGRPRGSRRLRWCWRESGLSSSGSVFVPAFRRSSTWWRRQELRFWSSKKVVEPDLAAQWPWMRTLVIPNDLSTLPQFGSGDGILPSLTASDLFLLNPTLRHDWTPQMCHAYRAAVVRVPLKAVQVRRSHRGRGIPFRLFRHRSDSGCGRPISRLPSLDVQRLLMERFDAGARLDLIERNQVTVLSCVSTQFIMMLNEQDVRPRELSSLRCMFTGGEAVPFDPGRRVRRSLRGPLSSSSYGSNETGALSRTTMVDSRERRLRTGAGQVLEEMEVRLFDKDGLDITGQGKPGIPGCRGPATCLGYYDDEGKPIPFRLVTADGWMLMGDIVEIDDAGYLVSRWSDFRLHHPAVERI